MGRSARLRRAGLPGVAGLAGLAGLAARVEWTGWAARAGGVGRAVSLATGVVTGRVTPDALAMAWNSASLVVSWCIAAGLGQVTWILAARLFAPGDVGVASGFLSATMLCAQIALLGLGSAVTTLLPSHRDRPEQLLKTVFTTVAVSAAAIGGAFLLLARFGLSELNVFASRPSYAVTFLASGVLLSLGLLADQTFTALRRADQVAVRSALAGIARVGTLVLLAVLLGRESALPLLIALACQSGLACFLAIAQLQRALPGYRHRLGFERGLARTVLRIGLPNHFLSLAVLAPGLILPLIVAETLSAAHAAYWYVAWMLAGLAFVAPGSMGMALFAELTHRTHDREAAVRQGLRWALTFGGAVAVALAAGADLLLLLLGPDYRAAGALPLRLLLLGILPVTLIEAYVATCRASGRIAEGGAVCAVSGLLSVAGAVFVGQTYGLVGVALAWLAAQTLAGGWAAWRLSLALRRPARAPSSARAPAAAPADAPAPEAEPASLTVGS